MGSPSGPGGLCTTMLRYENAPALKTILPNGVVENDHILSPEADGGLITFPYPQDIEAPLAEKHLSTPFVWQRDDGTYALVQTWTTDVNDSFRKTFDVSTSNSDPTRFLPQAVTEFKKVIVELFGAAAAQHPILCCTKTTQNDRPTYVGTARQLQLLLCVSQDVLKEKDIVELTPHGFVTRCVDGNGKASTQDFAFPNDDEVYVLYTKVGWHTMACVKTKKQFDHDCTLGEPEREGPASGIVPAVPTAEVRALVERDGYGRVPHYLRETMDGLEDEQEYIEALPATEAEAEDLSGKRPVRLLTDAERSSLLESLGAKREQMARCFESDLDAHPEEVWKRRVRERYEPEIQQIDKDIVQMSQRYIFVASGT